MISKVIAHCLWMEGIGRQARDYWWMRNQWTVNQLDIVL